MTPQEIAIDIAAINGILLETDKYTTAQMAATVSKTVVAAITELKKTPNHELASVTSKDLLCALAAKYGVTHV